MNIAVFGLGYVGCVTTACLARDGHSVIGVDIQTEKVADFNQGISPMIEPGLDELLDQGVQSGCISATTSVIDAVECSDLAIVCVGTPSQANGDLDLSYVERVCHEIGNVLARKSGYTVVSIRSTMLPGRAKEQLIPTLESASGKRVGDDFGFVINPEFLREGTAIADFDTPPYTIIGEYDQRSGDVVAELYQSLDAEIFRMDLGAAEMLKYSSNAFHALKVVFANEIGNLCQAYGVDSHQVMDVFTHDTKLNLSPNYLKPGAAFGGSCLGKDTRALLYAARQRDLRVPVLESILPSNQLQIEKALNILLREENRKVGIVGLSFKPDTDDLRESPAVELVERLVGKGFKVRIYDKQVSLGDLRGSNELFISNAIPHIHSLMCDTLEKTVAESESIVITKNLNKDEYQSLKRSLSPKHSLIDLVRLNGRLIPGFRGSYHGICW
ncbi:MAG: nucleotide sugar dehydrogenase [Chloroflexota bacterium]